MALYDDSLFDACMPTVLNSIANQNVYVRVGCTATVAGKGTPILEGERVEKYSFRVNADGWCSWGRLSGQRWNRVCYFKVFAYGYIWAKKGYLAHLGVSQRTPLFTSFSSSSSSPV